MLHQSSFETGSATAISLPEVVGAFSYTLDVAAGQAAGHSVRCCWIGMHVGRAMDLAAEDLHELYYVLLLGNSGFGQLHVSAAVAQGISRINEHWDGSGEPGRLRGEAIPVSSRVALLAQVADLTFARASAAGAIREVARLSGSWLDPAAAAAFDRVSKNGFLWSQLTGPFLDARVSMLAPAEPAGSDPTDLLGDITIDLGRMLRAKSVDRDCVAAFRRAGLFGR
jgi:hypothetical protein